MQLTTKLIPRLHVGGSWRANPPDRDWDAIYTVCWPQEVVGTPPARAHLTLSMFDYGFVDRLVVGELREAVVHSVSAGNKTLVRCAQGLNRSALVAVLAAHDLTGQPREQLVRRLRERRSRDVLNNEAFEGYLLRG